MMIFAFYTTGARLKATTRRKQ